MNTEIINIENAKKLANYDKLLAKYTEVNSSYRLLATKYNNMKKTYKKHLDEKDNEIKKLNEDLNAYKSKQMDIFGGN